MFVPSAKMLMRRRVVVSSLLSPSSSSSSSSSFRRWMHSSRFVLKDNKDNTNPTTTTTTTKDSSSLTTTTTKEVLADASYFADENKVYPLSEDGTNVVMPPPAEPMACVVESPLGHGPNKHVHRARIYYRNKLPGQNYKGEKDRPWTIEFNIQDTWQNPLMGWNSGEAVHNSLRDKMKFLTKEDAIGFAKDNGFHYEVSEPNKRKKSRPRNYGDNFNFYLEEAVYQK